MKKIIVVLILAILLAVGGYFYITRPIVEQSRTAAEEVSKNEPLATKGEENKFRLVAEESKASFSIYEELRGEPVTVVGTTGEVAGNIILDEQDFSRSQIGEVVINARTFKTDSTQRDGAVGRLILESEKYEFIYFRPQAILVSAGSLTAGNLKFSVSGELQIREIKKVVSFEGVARLEGGMLKGLVSAMVSLADFGLQVPNLAFLANVAEETKLSLDFVAKQ